MGRAHVRLLGRLIDVGKVTMPRTRKPKRPATAGRARPAHAPRIPRLTFAAWIRKWRLGPGMNDRHPEILEWMGDYARIIGPERAAEMGALHAEGFYSGFDGRVGPGWLPLLDRLVADLVEMGWDRDLPQVKSKFHTLHFYVGTRTRKMDARIRAAELESHRTCCQCGVKVKVRRGDPEWLPGWCGSCLEKVEAQGERRWIPGGRARK